MTTSLVRRACLHAATVVAFAALAVPASAAGLRIERTLDLPANGTVVVDAAVGSVEVRGGGRHDVRVLVTADREEITDDVAFGFETVGDEARITARSRRPLRGGWFRGSSRNLRFVLEVPQGVSLRVQTAGGSIFAESVDGAARLKTSGGSIRAQRLGGALDAETSGGSIQAQRIAGDARLETSGGSIRASGLGGWADVSTSGGSIGIAGVAGDLVARTSGGSIQISDAGGAVRARTTGGSVRAAFLPGNDRGGELSTSGGGVTATVDPAVGLTIDASSSGGRVDSSLPLTVAGAFSRTAVRGTLNGGGATLRLRSSGGGVTINGH